MITKKSKKYFDVALAASKLSDYARIRIGAIIVHNNDIISVGFNRIKSHPIQKKYNIYRGFRNENSYIHAEMAALVKTKHLDLKGASIYISRNNGNGENAICKPCAACMKAILDRGIRKIFYTTNEGYEELVFN
jgi:deoxycytidylate deaminase